MALSKEELIRLMNHKFASARLQHIADLYIFQSFTGFAFVDLLDFDFEKHTKEIDGQVWIFKARIKSHVEAIVPLFAG